MGDELVDLLERARIEQEFDPLARRQLAGLVLLAEPILAAAELRAALQLFEILERVHLRLHRLRLLPVLQELFEPDVGQRMPEHAIR